MQGNAEIIEIVVDSGTSDPSSPVAGELYYRSDLQQLRFFNGTSWVSTGVSSSGTVTYVAATGSTGLTVGGSPITTSGTLTLTLGTELQALSGLSTTGYVQRTGTGTYNTRQIPYYFQTTGASLSGSALTCTGINIQPASGTQSYIQVFRNGVFQQEGSSFQYTVTTSGVGGVITFNSGAVPTSTDNLVVFAFA